MLDTIYRITSTPNQSFYTIHVPGCEHYFANGILHHNSGKTFIILSTIVIRAMKAPGSTHVVLRHHFNHLKESVINDTLPKLLRLRWPDITYNVNRSDWFFSLPGGSRILFGGLDDKERTEKILGQEHSTIFLNECSQISYQARNKAVTRLAQNSGLKLKAFYDCNPPSMAHWTARLFIKHQEPTSGAALPNPDRYAAMRMNPDDNIQNLPPEYIAELEALPDKDRRRFRYGEFLAQVDNALWTIDRLDELRIARSQLPDMMRVIVAIDPSGAAGPEDQRSDEIGIVVAGTDRLGNAYVLEDLSGHYSPQGWARAALTAFDRWNADRIVAERNFGGAMVESTIRAERRTASVKLVTASRGKAVRAEPVAALYEQGRVRHLGVFPDLEDQLSYFSTAGYQGDKSPDRADAAVWALTELMLEKQGVALIAV